MTETLDDTFGALSPEEEAELDAELAKPITWLRVPCGCEFFLDGAEVAGRVARCPEGKRLEAQYRAACRAWSGSGSAITAFPIETVLPLFRAFNAHVDQQVALAARRIRLELLTALEGLCSDDAAVVEAARQTRAGQMWIAAARKRRVN